MSETRGLGTSSMPNADGPSREASSLTAVLRDDSRLGTRVSRWLYPAEMRRQPVDPPVVVATNTWIRQRLAAHGFGEPGGAWQPGAQALVHQPGQAEALHATLCDLVQRARSLRIHERSTLDDHYVRSELNREMGGIVRCLTKTRAPLDGTVFTELLEWSGWADSEGPVQWYFTYAPMRTLRSIEPWLYEAVTTDGLPVHERALLMRPLARLDKDAALRVARELLDESPWASAELLGMHGDYADLELLDSRLPRYRQRGFAEDRRKLEAAIRKIARRLTASARA